MNDIKVFFSKTINMIYTLIAINAIVFFMGLSTPLMSDNINLGAIVASIFSHGGTSHLFFNMLGIYIFGTLLIRALNSWQFLGLYLASGIIGNVVFMAFFHGNYMLLGASGAVFGIMTVAAMVEPNQKFMLIFMPFFALKTKTLVVVYTIVELLSQMSGAETNIAHLAHLGGILGGYLFAELFAKKYIVWEPFGFLKRGRKPKMEWKTYNQTSYTVKDAKFTNPKVNILTPVTQKELDYLLDKVSNAGINSLTPSELARLKQAREEIMGSTNKRG